MRCWSRVTTFAAFTLILIAIGSTRSLADGYDMALIPPPQGGAPTVYRINVTSGEVSSISGSAFSVIKDPQAIPAGKYQLYFTATPDNKTYWLYRLETQSGRTWFCSGTTWAEIK